MSTGVPNSHGPHRLGVLPPPDPPRYEPFEREPGVTVPLSMAVNLMTMLADADQAHAFGECPEKGAVLRAGSDPCMPCMTMEALMWSVARILDRARLAPPRPAPPGDCE